MKIIFVVSAMNGGGAERVVATLANQYVQKGDNITILMIAGDNSVYPLDERIKCLSIGAPSKGNPIVQIKRFFAMRKFFKKHKDSKIVSFSTRTNLFTIVASLGLRRSIVVSERNDPNRYNHIRLRDTIYNLGAEMGVKFVFQTEVARDCFPEKIKENSIVIPNPLRKNIPDPFSGDFNKKEKKIAAIGRLEEQKNYILLLGVYADFCRFYPDYELHIFGEGSQEKKLKEFTKKKGIADKVFWEGFQSNILEKIKNYKIYVLSSDYEGIPNSLIEAMAMGVACISTDCPVGGPALCIASGINGLLIPMRDPDAFVKAMRNSSSRSYR